MTAPPVRYWRALSCRVCLRIGAIRQHKGRELVEFKGSLLLTVLHMGDEAPSSRRVAM
jgi:hypothetical protein